MPTEKEDKAFVQEIERILLERLKAKTLASDMLAALEQFGSLMVDEIVGRTGVIESKALSILGWTTALLAFLLFDLADNRSVVSEPPILLRLTMVAALVALIAAAGATRARKWPWPKDSSWFCADYFDDSLKLRVYHLLAVLEIVQRHRQINESKAISLTVAQWALIVAALATGWRLLVRAIG